jgi:hypothetical protein
MPAAWAASIASAMSVRMPSAAHVVDGHDVRVVERGEQRAFAPEALAVDGIDADVFP